MKRLLLPLLVVVSFHSFSQRNNSYGITLAFGQPVIIKTELTGGPSLNPENSYNLGFNYYRRISDAFKLETGLMWYSGKIGVTPAPNPNVDRITKDYDVGILYLPLYARYNFTKHFFINGGISVNADVSRNQYIMKQNGLGAGAGFGWELFISKNLALQLSPYLQMHSILSTENAMYPEKILDTGIKAGIRTR